MTTPQDPANSENGVLTLIRDTINGSRGYTAWSGRRMYLYTEDGLDGYTFDLAPSELDYGEFGNEWVKTERPGSSPLLQYKAEKLAEMSFSFTMSDRTTYAVSQTNAILRLQTLARSKRRLMVRYSSMEQGLWRMTSLKVKSMLRHPLTNDPIRCTADCTLTRAQDPDPTGPIGGPPLQVIDVSKPAPRTYTVQDRQTLGSISQEVYGTPLLWQKLWDANPQLVLPWELSTGMVLLVP